jgi:hypothetical protein
VERILVQEEEKTVGCLVDHNTLEVGCLASNAQEEDWDSLAASPCVGFCVRKRKKREQKKKKIGPNEHEIFLTERRKELQSLTNILLIFVFFFFFSISQMDPHSRLS